MLLTEEEAREKWCVHARETSEGSSGNFYWDFKGERNECKCIASECMAWRFTEKRGGGPIREDVQIAGQAHKLENVPGCRWRAGEKKDGTITWGLFPLLGYCGLAGKTDG